MKTMSFIHASFHRTVLKNLKCSSYNCISSQSMTIAVDWNVIYFYFCLLVVAWYGVATLDVL